MNPRAEAANKFGVKRASGMALIAVLWIVAALSIMVTGLVYTVRQQIQIAATQRDQVSGQALAEAAVALVMQEMLGNSTRLSAIESTTVSYGGVQMAIEVAPLNGWIALNGAGPDLFATLLRTAGGLDSGRAQALASDIVAWRDTAPPIDPTAPGAGGAMRQRRFEAVEDLLLVPGIDYPLYARIAPLVSADLQGGAQVNPQAAPPEVLAVLAQGNLGQVAQFLAQRDNGQPGDASGFSNAGVIGGSAAVYRLRVKVPLEAGKILLLTRDVALSGSYPGSAPWRVLRTDRQLVASSPG
jgi:general secretion pathway protein K